MKKKIGFLLFCTLFTFMFTSCGEILSIVTADANGKKVINNYMSIYSSSVYDKDASLKNWRNLDALKAQGEDSINMDELIFEVVNKKENIVVAGDKEKAIELKFFDGGYNYSFYAATNSFSEDTSNSVEN